MNLTRFILRISLFVFIPLLFALTTYKFLNRAFYAPLDPSSKNIVLIELSAGRTIQDVAHELERKSALRYWWSLWFLARFSDKDQSVRAGEYEITAAMTPGEMLQKLVKGEMLQRKVVVRPGATLVEIAASVQEAGLISKEDFLTGVYDRKTLQDASIKNNSFEGYLFPETYVFSRPITAREIIWRMLEEGEQKSRWPDEYSDQANKLNLSRHEILTLASIIEKESIEPSEQPVVSSVFHNRLAKGMKLQSDPTIIYGLENFSGTISEEDKQNPHPYNTYVNYGLPPGPICSPGENAIKAALFPQETDFLYSVAKGDGTHVFSASYQEYQAAIDLYIKGHSANEAAMVPEMSPSPTPTPPSTTATSGGHAIVTFSTRQK